MGKRYHRNIIFTRTPLKGKFSYKDIFQIYPINIDGAPTANRASHYPVLIEFWTEEEDVPEVKTTEYPDVDKLLTETSVQTNKLNRLTNLLSSILNFRFFSYSLIEKYWFMPFPEKITPEMNNITSGLGLPWYHFPKMGSKLSIDKFSNPDFDNVQYLPDQFYYLYDPVEDKNKEVNFPNSIVKILDEYFGLDLNGKKVVDSATYQICNAIDTRLAMKSLSFFSAVSAIETLIHYENKNHKIEFECGSCKRIKSSSYSCQKCGKPIWGVAAQFREFLVKYVSSRELHRKKFNKIYSVRSKIAHTEYLLSGDGVLSWEFNDKTNEVYMLHLEAIQYSRIALVGWLLKRNQ